MRASVGWLSGAGLSASGVTTICLASGDSGGDREREVGDGDDKEGNVVMKEKQIFS
jgi:hypothetical protein